MKPKLGASLAVLLLAVAMQVQAKANDHCVVRLEARPGVPEPQAPKQPCPVAVRFGSPMSPDAARAVPRLLGHA